VSPKPYFSFYLGVILDVKDGAEYIYTLIIGIIIFGVAKFLLGL